MLHHRWTSLLIRVSSALSSAVVLVAWVGSVWVSADWIEAPQYWRARIARGAIDVSYFDTSGFEISHCGGLPCQPPPSLTISGVRFQYDGDAEWPFQWRPHFTSEWHGAFWAIGVPLWMPLAPLAAIAGLTNGRAIRARRRNRGNTCGACGYSLAGLLSGAMCPECGTSPVNGSRA